MSSFKAAPSRVSWRGASLAVLAALIPGAALAQDGQSEVSEVVITGSRVVRDGSQAPTPVTVVAAEQLATVAPRNLAEGLMQLPSFRGSTSTNSGGLGNGGGTSNIAWYFIALIAIAAVCVWFSKETRARH